MSERVDDVTTHPAFRNTVRMIARLYDALHDSAKKDVLTTPTETGKITGIPASTGVTSLTFRATDALGGVADKGLSLTVNP